MGMSGPQYMGDTFIPYSWPFYSWGDSLKKTSLSYLGTSFISPRSSADDQSNVGSTEISHPERFEPSNGAGPVKLAEEYDNHGILVDTYSGNDR